MEDALLLNMIPQTYRYTPLGSSPNIPIKSNLSKLKRRNPALVSCVSKINSNIHLNSKLTI